MLSLPVLIPNSPSPHHEQTVTIRQRDVVGSMRVFVAEKQDEVAVSSLTNKRLYLRHPAGDGIWLDNSNVFSTYAINPNRDVLELRQVEIPLPSQPNHHRSCLKLIIPFQDYGVVFSEFLENPRSITVEAVKKTLMTSTLFNISPTDNTQLWYFWPHDHSLNQLPDNTLPLSHPNFHQLHSRLAPQVVTTNTRGRTSSFPRPIPIIQQSSSQTFSHPLQSTPPQVNFLLNFKLDNKDKDKDKKDIEKEEDTDEEKEENEEDKDKDNGNDKDKDNKDTNKDNKDTNKENNKEPFRETIEPQTMNKDNKIDQGRRNTETEKDRENCEECKREQMKYMESLRIRGDEALRRVLCTPHTHLEFCVMWTPRVALLKSIKRRIVILIHSLSIYKTLVFQHRTTVEDALQLLTEFVQFTNEKSTVDNDDGHGVRDPNTGPPQKRYALFKDGIRLEEDKLLAELVDSQVLWTRVVCVFMEIGVVSKPTPAPQKSVSAGGEERPEEPDGDDCHMLVLYKKQQSFHNFHFNPAISVGTALKIIIDSFNVPPTTINQEDWGFRIPKDITTVGSLPRVSTMEIGEEEISLGSTPTGTTSSTSGGETPPVVGSSNGNHNDNGTMSQSPPISSSYNPELASSVPPSPNLLSPSKPASFPFSLFSNKNSANVELSPVSSPLLALSASTPGDPNYVPPANQAQSAAASVGVKIGSARSVAATNMANELDRYEYMLYDFHKHEWLDNDRTLASYKFHTKYTNFSGRSAPPRALPHINLSESIPVEVQLRARPRMRRMALIDGVDFTVPLDPNANAVLVYSPSTTVAAAIDEVQALSGIREPSLELFVRYNVSAAAAPSSPSLLSSALSGSAKSSSYFGGNGATEKTTGGSQGSYAKLYVERVCLEFGKTLWSYNFLPTSTLEIVVEDQEKDTEVLEEQALKAFGGHSTSFLPGEFTQHTRDHVTHFEERVGGECATGRLIITNYRLIFHAQNRSSYKDLAYSDDIDVPLCTIDKVKPLQFSGSSTTTTGLDLTCKDMRNIMLGWRNDGGKNLANILKKLMPAKQEDFFAFANKESYSGPGWDTYDPEAEYKRLGLAPSSIFRLTRANRDYTLCPSYPAVFAVPSSINDEMLTKVASFREKGRIPAVTWVHPNGASITRCSQPRVGLGRARCVEDEMLLKALSEGNKTLYLIDSRPMANAMYNTIAGRGFETAELYPNTKLIFLGIGNIHVMRESFKKLVDLCLSRSTDDEDTHWLSALESCNWMEHARVIIKSSTLMVELIDRKSCSVVTHCSDGWDRTSQIVALAELLLDPFYRSIRGFEILLEKDWLSFGHMFGARSGNWLEAGATKENEFAPIFLLFLDAVYKVTAQFPTSFEFNENFLLTIADAVYDCRFGTFLYNSEKDRVEMGLKSKTVSLWAYINNNKRFYTNPHYNPQSQQRVLYPSIRYPKLVFWSGYYLRYVKTYTRPTDSVDARTWQLIDENAALKAHIEKLQAGIS